MDDFVKCDYLYGTYKTYLRRVKEIKALLAKCPDCHDDSISLINEALERADVMRAKYFTLLVSELTMIDDDEGEEYEQD